MDEVTIGTWPARKLGPSGIFEHIDLDTVQMVTQLDRKMQALASPAGYSGRMFGKWLSAVHELASAVIFHGGELISEGSDPLTVMVFTDGRSTGRILDSTQGGVCREVLSIGVVGIADILPLVETKDGASTLRPFLSSELLVLGARRDVEMMEAFFGSLRAAFESHFMDDLAALVSSDLKREIFRDSETGQAGKKARVPVLMEETDFSGRKPVKRRVIEEREFERMAIRAMCRRMVPPGLQAFIMPRVKEAAGRSGQCTGKPRITS